MNVTIKSKCICIVSWRAVTGVFGKFNQPKVSQQQIPQRPDETGESCDQLCLTQKTDNIWYSSVE